MVRTEFNLREAHSTSFHKYILVAVNEFGRRQSSVTLTKLVCTIITHGGNIDVLFGSLFKALISWFARYIMVSVVYIYTYHLITHLLDSQLLQKLVYFENAN